MDFPLNMGGAIFVGGSLAGVNQRDSARITEELRLEGQQCLGSDQLPFLLKSDLPRRRGII